MIEVRGEQFDEGSDYAQVTRRPIGNIETSMNVERLDDLREIRMRCTTTGTYARWLLTETRATPSGRRVRYRPRGFRKPVFDSTFGKTYFRRWLEQSLAALDEIAAQK